MEKCPECGGKLIQIRPLYKYYECQHCKSCWEIVKSSKERIDEFLKNF